MDGIVDAAGSHCTELLRSGEGWGFWSARARMMMVTLLCRKGVRISRCFYIVFLRSCK